jgi:uncharacterized protein (DUF433 family)
MTAGYRWPPAPDIEDRGGEPYLAGTDFAVRFVRGYSVVGAANTVAWIAEDWGDTLTRQQIAAAVRYYDAHWPWLWALDEERDQASATPHLPP